MKATHFVWLVQRAWLPNALTLLPRGYFTPAICKFSSSKSFLRLGKNSHDDMRVRSEQEPSSCTDFSQRLSGDDNYIDEDYVALYSKYNSVSKEHGVASEQENNEHDCDSTIDIISVNEALDLVRNKLFEDANQNKDLSDSKAVAADLLGSTSSSVRNSVEKDKKSFEDGSDTHVLQRNKMTMAKSRKITDNSSKESSYKVPSHRKKIVIKKKENSIIYENHRKILNDSATNSTSSELQYEKAFISDNMNVKNPGVLNSQSKDFLHETKKLSMKQSRENRKGEREEKKVALIKSIQADKESSMYRESPLRIQMLSSGLHQQLYGEKQYDTEQQEDVLRSIDHLKDHDFWGREPSVAPDVDFQLPSFRSKDLCQHFEIIAVEQSAPYRNLLGKLIRREIPPEPTNWNYEVGWSQYREDGTVIKVDYPECKAIVFDVEVCNSEGNQPTLAVAVSDKYWYSWCSEQLINSDFVPQREVILSDLIPLEGLEDEPRIVVGHNVSYDRVRVKEQYSTTLSKLRFLDTMSMHISVSGLSQEQRSLYLKNKGSRSEYNHPWMFVGSPNNLSDVYKFYCKTEGLKKDIREVFIKGNLDDVRSDFQNLVSYCASDVHATYHVLQKLYPLFQERLPHPASFSGMLEMGTALLPVNENWNRYISSSELEYEKMEHILNEELVKQARDALQYQENSKYSEDLWLWDLDWATPKGRVKKLQGYPSWYRKLCVKTGTRENTPEPEKMSTSLQVVPKLLKLTWNGYPLHYEKKHGWGYLIPEFKDFSTLQEMVLDKSDKAQTSSKKQPVFPIKALYELHSTLCEKKKSAEAVSEEFEDVLEIGIEDLDINDQVLKKTKSRLSGVSKDGKDIGIPGVLLVPLPHRDGPGNRVGNPLAKDFLTRIESKVLSSYIVEIAELVLRTSKVLSYWRNNRDRILSQMVIWEDVQESEEDTVENSQRPEDMNLSKVGFIVPQVVTAGTITRRGVEKTWMTASNAYADRIGSELKAMVQAPPGYHLVGADVDSQELWIAAVLGDAYFAGLHGSTALGWMVLQGSKSHGTDMHSRTAATATISRDHAKVLNYGRIYGAGLRFIERLLHQFNPKLTKEETKQKAKDLMEATKGQKVWWLSKEGKQSLEDIGVTVPERPFSRNEVYSFSRALRRQQIDVSFQDITDGKAQWFGGTESHMFNCLEAIAQCDQARTPVLRAQITRALESQYVEDQFMPSRINWVVQSSAVDYLHLMLVCMKWLMEEYNIKGRFCISIHDEVRYLVASEDRYRAALALHITNLLTRTIFSLKLGMKDLPLSVAFFSGVDIDKVLRKEPNADCITPSNPKGLREGYNIPFGETLDIYKTLEITQGKL